MEQALELYPDEWDSDSELTDDEDHHRPLGTNQDQTRDENMSQAANLSPDIRAPTAGFGLASPEINFSMQQMQNLPEDCPDQQDFIDRQVIGRGILVNNQQSEERKDEIGSGLMPQGAISGRFADSVEAGLLAN